MTINEFEDYFTNKIKENEKFIRITYYELRIVHNLSNEETEEFLNYSKRKLEGLGYEVYFTGDKYIYPNVTRTVEANELLIAVKAN